LTDPLAKGAFIGLTLAHNRAHVWRSILEAVCFGTRACIEGLSNAGHRTDSIIIAGGATKSLFWLQMHADVTGIPVITCQNTDAPLLGCAILASVAAGVHDTIPQACMLMVRDNLRIEPNQINHQLYSKLYENIYKKLAPSISPLVHSLAQIRGGSKHNNKVQISPSLLACDFSNIQHEMNRLKQAGTTRLHLDVFDGVFIDSPYALTFGPHFVKTIRALNKDVLIDVHVCVVRPQRYIDAIASSGANTFIFQWESQKNNSLKEVIHFILAIKQSGLLCGVSLNPSTNLEDIFPLLQINQIDSIVVMAVEAGFGGQIFQHNIALPKIQQLHNWRQQYSLSYNIMVDGGINVDTARKSHQAGADILVTGTWLFQHEKGIQKGFQQIIEACELADT